MADFKAQRPHENFIEALQAGTKLKQKFPHSHIRVLDVDEALAPVSSLVPEAQQILRA